MKDVDASKPCLKYSFSNAPPSWVHVFSNSCANSSLRTQCAAAASANAHCPTVFHRRNRRARKKRQKQDLSLREMVVPPNQVKLSIAEIDSKVIVVLSTPACQQISKVIVFTAAPCHAWHPGPDATLLII